MNILNFEKLLRLLGVILIILAIFAIQAFIAFVILSMLIVPITWIYSKFVGRSYNSVIDSSNMLYKLNIVGQWALAIGITLTLAWTAFQSF